MSVGQREQTTYTEKSERHEACGYSYMVVTSDREVSGSKVYRGENAVGTFLSNILQEEVKIRESLATPKLSLIFTSSCRMSLKNVPTAFSPL